MKAETCKAGIIFLSRDSSLARSQKTASKQSCTRPLVPGQDTVPSLFCLEMYITLTALSVGIVYIECEHNEKEGEGMGTITKITTFQFKFLPIKALINILGNPTNTCKTNIFYPRPRTCTRHTEELHSRYILIMHNSLS